jgi:tetratricopeptide (TPR) repeat protein
MKFLSTTALTLALTLGAVAVTGVTPAEAKKKDDAGQASAAKYSDAFRQAAPAVQDAIGKKDWATAQAGLPKAQAAASTPDDKYAVASFQLQIAQGTGDAAGTQTAIDAMLASGKAPADLQIQLYEAQGQTAFNANKLDVADRAFTQVNTLKPNDPEILISLAAVKSRENQTQAALQFTDQAIQAQKAAGKPVDEDWYRRALSIAYDGKSPAGVIKYGQQLVDAYPRSDIWRIALETYRETTQLDPQSNLDTMRLMRVTNALAGEKDYYELSNAALNKGFPGEAKGVIDQGMSSNMVDNKSLATSKALAEIKQLAGSKIAADKASLPASDKKARAAANGQTALVTGDAYLGYGQFPQAIDLYKVALQKGGVDANVVNLHMGEALAQSGQKPAAAQAFASVTGPLQTVAQYWTIYANKGAQPAAPAQAAAPAAAPQK